jgi:single-strand DNA-binding protein
MINSVVLAGNVCADPESRSTNSGKAVATFRLAVNNPINDKEVVYIDVDTWEKQAEFVGNYVKKGSSVSVVGRLKQDSWEKDGKKMTKTLVVAERINFLGGKKKGEDAEAEEAVAPKASKPVPKTYSKPAAKQSTQQDDDDIPI